MAYSVEQSGAVFPDYCYCVGLHFLIRKKIQSKETGLLEQKIQEIQSEVWWTLVCKKMSRRWLVPAHELCNAVIDKM